MPKKAIWVKSYLREDGVPVKAHTRLVDYEPTSPGDAARNGLQRVALRTMALASENEPGVKAIQLYHEEWVAFRSAVKNKLRRYTDKADRSFGKEDGLPIEATVSVPSGLATFVDTLRDFSSVGVVNPAAFVAAGAMAFSLAFLPVATQFNDRTMNYTGRNPARKLLQKLYKLKPYEGDNKFRKWLNKPQVARSVVNGAIGGAGAVLAFAVASPVAPVIAGLTLLEVFHEHAAAADAKAKLNKRNWGPVRTWVNEPRTVPRMLATASAGVAAFTLGAPALVVGGAAFTAYQLQKWVQRTQAKRDTTSEDVTLANARRLRPDVITPAQT
jgi:hypothetical protein